MRALSFFVRATLLWCVALALPGCIDPYMPDAISSTRSYLVVDGFINSRGITTIILSRTYDIAANGTAPVEARATLSIEEEGGTRHTLPESAVRGTYTSAALTLNPTKKYRLHILTSTGKEYASNYVGFKNTPPIDDITWRTSATGLNIYVNTHDDTRQTQYYRWEYEETWEINSPYKPVVEYKNGKMQDITVPYPSACWVTSKSSDVKISNTTRLSQDVVSDYLLRSYSTTADRLRNRYSILVKQYGQTQEEYQYWELLKKNTENIGTLFDPLPAQLTGNVRCLNDDAEITLGYIGVHSVEQKRIFISRPELPGTWAIQSGYESCVPPDSIWIDRPAPPLPIPAQVYQAAFGSSSGYLPIEPIYGPTGVFQGYTAASKDCIDCRTRGTAVKPSFWP